jgi:hypothetical protein
MVISHKYKFIFIKTAKVSGTSIESFFSDVCGQDDIITTLWHHEPAFSPRNFTGYFNPIPEVVKRYKGCGFSVHAGNEHTYNNFKNKIKFHEGMPAWQIKCRTSKKIWNSYFKFTIERNPWDKCISRYFHSKSVFESKYKKSLSFEDWFSYFENRLKNPHTTRAWGSEAPYNYPRYADPWNNKILVDKICRYENRDTDLIEVFKHLGIQTQNFENYKLKTHYRTDRRHYSEFLNSYYVQRIRDIFQKEIDLLAYSF